MPKVAQAISSLSRSDIHKLEDGGELIISGHPITESDVVVSREALPDLVVMSEGHLTIALDTELDVDLKDEGLMRETLSQLQRLRKAKDLEVTARIELKLFTESEDLRRALLHHQIYLAAELLADELSIEKKSDDIDDEAIEIIKMDIDGEALHVMLQV
jgi:isoleucyl-tRNA synthetase